MSFASRFLVRRAGKVVSLGTRLEVTREYSAVCIYVVEKPSSCPLGAEIEGVSKIVPDSDGGGGDETPEFVGRATPFTHVHEAHAHTRKASERTSERRIRNATIATFLASRTHEQEFSAAPLSYKTTPLYALSTHLNRHTH